jgi:hypothetical protein
LEISPYRGTDQLVRNEDERIPNITLRHKLKVQYFYLRNNSCRPYFIVIQIWVGIIFMGVKSHEYNAYPYLNKNKVWPA